MSVELSTPTVTEIREVVDVLSEWQDDDAPLQLHPGDLGWNWQFGTDAVIAGVRVWRQDGRIVGIGMGDDDVLRLTTARDTWDDTDLARRIADDLADPARGVLPEGDVGVETPTGSPVHDALVALGWGLDDPWTPLQRDLRDPVDDSGLRIEDVGPGQVDARIAVHRSAFDSNRFNRDHWSAMVSGVPHENSRHLLGYDGAGDAVAMVSVWSAGPGRPGLLEPLGVHQDHRGQGHGRAISLAAAAALRELGSSSAQVCTPSSNVGGVATYVAAGYEPLPERYDAIRRTSTPAG